MLNLGLSNVIVYAKPYTSIKSTLNDAGQETEDVAVDKTGLVGVTNYLTSALAPGSVSFFAKNSTQPCSTVKDPNWVYFFNDAFDASGNLFIDGQTVGGGTLVGEVSGGCKATSITTLSVGNTISWPGGVQVSDGNILIGDVNKQAIYTYAPPSGGSLGSPTVVTTLAGAVAPVTFAIEENGKHVRTADVAANRLYAGLYRYPKGAYVSKLADHMWAVAVAVCPGAAIVSSGLYRATVAARALDAINSGARYLIVDALPTSRPILERLGFVCLTYTWPCTLKR